MTILGRFQETEGGYSGALRTLALKVDLEFVAAGLAAEKAPSHRILCGEVECGAAWPAEDESAILNVRLDDPCWPEPIRARLVRGREDAILLVWRRPSGP